MDIRGAAKCFDIPVIIAASYVIILMVEENYLQIYIYSYFLNTSSLT